MDFANKSNIFDSVKVKCAKTYSNVLLVFFAFICCVLFCFSLLLTPKQVDGSSMIQTLNNKDIVYIFKQKTYRVGDIVVLRKNNTQTKVDVIKRIVAVGGDKFEIKEVDGTYKIVVNNEVVEEDYIYSHMDMKICYISFQQYLNRNNIQEDYIIIEQNKVFVLGDNRGDSIDSSYYGPRSASEIEGRVLLVFPASGWFWEFKIIW